MSHRLNGCLLLLTPFVLAQNPPDGGTREVMVSIHIAPTAGVPFQATLNTEWVRPLGDGTRITLKNHRMIARDKEGRIFQERRLLVPDNGKQQSVVTQTEILDPLLHQQYICVPSERVCQLEEMRVIEPRKARPADEESLGKRWIVGLETTGTRQMRTIPAGAVGNDSPIHTKMEYWYSEHLGLNLLSTRDDPRTGTQQFEISDLVEGEPDAKLFAPPEGSKIIDLRGTVDHKEARTE